MARTKKDDAASEVAEVVELDHAAQTQEQAPVAIEQPLTFAEVMRINRQLREAGLVPADPVLPPKKRVKLKRF